MATPLDTYNEFKNWIWLNFQKTVPIEADKLNIQAQSLKDHIRRAICELIGNGAGYDGFLIVPTDPSDPTIKAGSIFIAGHKLDLEADVTYSTQPWAVDAPAISNPAEGFYYLSVIEELIDQSDDAEIVDPLLGIECVQPYRLKWVVKYKAAPFTLPVPADNEYLMSLYIVSSTPPFADLDLRSRYCSVKAGVDTRYQDREGGILGSGHEHHLDDIWVISIGDGYYSYTDFQTVMDSIYDRILSIEDNTRFKTAKGGGTPGGTYGKLTGAINGVNQIYYLPDKYIAGSLHVYVGGVRLSPDGDDYSESDPETGKLIMVIAPESNSIILVDYIEDPL
jgi:hypothetical protein